MGTKRSDGVRAATKSSIEIDFYYRGTRCRERIKLAPTPRNMQYARNLRGQILVEIEKGVFDYLQHFPDSERAKIHSPKPKGLVTVTSALNVWYNEKAPALEHSTLIGYRRIIDNIIGPVIGKVLLRDFKRLHAKELITSLGDKVSAKRINNVLGPLRGMLAEAHHDELIETNPLDGFKVVRRKDVAEEDDVDPFVPEEVRLILATAEGQFRNYCLFNFATGLRTSEMIGLQWSDVDLIGKSVRIRRAHVMGKTKTTKTNAGRRVVKLIPAAVEALQAQKAHTLLAGGAVFHNPYTGVPWGNDRQVRE
ncbi:MAG: DUF3596 domain-containing protein, partial [Stenotrophomonas sp.]|nr:DUF3596 domain-containing protein [Stenotrophomonas sp.]